MTRILGIESSCDETAIALVSADGNSFKIEKNLLSSQVKIHAKYGGVVPEVAAREHAQMVFPLLTHAGVPNDGQGIDAIAVTVGPGLVSALRIGVELGKSLAWCWKKPLVAVNHLEGHIYSVWAGDEAHPKFPALCLIVSGGHTELILMKDHGQHELVGMTRDDAVGEAFDKVAKLLGLPYPGGPEIAKQAEKGSPSAVAFPRPMIDTNDFDFSFSGLKTAVKNYLAEGQSVSTEDVAASFQAAVIETLITKTIRAVKEFNPKSVVLVGGVSANKALRETLETVLKKKCPQVSFHAPDLKLTGDNAVMIAIAGAHMAKRQQFSNPLTLVADANMRLV